MKRLKVWVLTCVFLTTVMLIDTLSRGKIPMYNHMHFVFNHVRCVSKVFLGKGRKSFISRNGVPQN